MKTAITELIEYIESNEIVYNKDLILKLKEQIIDAYYGKIYGVFDYREEGQEYYNETYNQNK